MPDRSARRSRPSIALAALVLLAVVAAGCAGNDTPPQAGGATPTAAPTATPSPAAIPAASTDPRLAALVPAPIRAKGTLMVAAAATYPPNEFVDTDGTTIIGMDPDLAAALGQVLGLKVQLVNASFDAIIPGLAAGRYDLGMSSLTVTKQRQQAVDMVSYFVAGNSFITRAGAGIQLTGLGDLCGHTVAIEKGSTYVEQVTAEHTTCTKAGKPGIDMQLYPDQTAANLALTSGRAEITIADSPVAAYQVAQSAGKLQLVGKPYGPEPFGIAIAKGSGLATPILEALKKLIADGVYQQILTKWKLADGAIDTPVLNGATDE